MNTKTKTLLGTSASAGDLGTATAVGGKAIGVKVSLPALLKL